MSNGFIKIVPASEYQDGATGFVVEMLNYWNGNSVQSWAIPAWDERNCPTLDETFSTYEAAKRAVLECFEPHVLVMS